MALRNGPETIGAVTRTLHWVTAVLILSTLPLGLWIARMEPSLSALKYFGWHKTLGISILTLVVLRLLWHRLSPVPLPLPGGPPWQDRAARIVHGAFYPVLLAMPLSGWAASSATGIDTVIFNRWTLPRIAPVSPAWEQAGFTTHAVLGWTLAALIALHVSGALHRELILRDGTLRRMVRGRRQGARNVIGRQRS